MKKYFLYQKLNMAVFSAFAFIGLFSLSCSRDYIKGGEIENIQMYTRMTNYEVLKSLPQFDTLVRLIDAAKFRDKIDQADASFFAVHSSAVLSYLQERTLYLQNTVDQNKKFLLDSLIYYLQNNKNGTADSLGMYLLPNIVTSATNTSAIGTMYPSALAGNNVVVSFESTTDQNQGYYPGVSTVPRILYFTQLWKPYNLGPDSTAAQVPATTGIHARVSTAFLKTKNGVINVLAPGNLLFFNGTKPK